MSVGIGGLPELLRIIWSDATHFVKVRLAWVLSLVVTASILTALGPIALKLVVDGFTGQAPGAPLSPLFLIGLYVLSQWLARSIGELRGLVYARAERRLFRAVSEQLFAHLMQLPLRFHLQRQTGAVNQTLENGLQGYQMILHHLVFTVLPVTAELGTIVLVLTRLAHPVFLGLFCGALVGYAAAFAYAARTASRAAKTASAAHVAANAAMTDSILNYETVKCFTAESLVQEKVSRALARTEVEWVDFYRRYAVNGFIVATIFATFLGATILYAAHAVQGGQMTVGDFVLVNSYMLQLVKPVEMLGYAMQALSQGLAMLDKMLVLFNETPESQCTEDHEALTGAGQLEFEAVSLSYTPDRSVLKHVSFRIPAGKTLGIVGASGSGKSTLVRVLVRLLEPDEGRILLDGVPIGAMSLRTLRQAIAVVPQEPLLFDETIAYNIGFGKQGATQDEIEQAAKLAHLHEFILSLPERYNTRVGERGVQLSGGEKQRLSIARAAIKQPRIYVFDEATSSLDSVSERGIVQNLRDLARLSTTVVIAHRLSTVVHADEIAVLDRGTIIESGTHAALLCRGGRYAALWMAQQQGSVAA
ncbi:MAG: ABC transporter ATP-binding protein [Proteobacteria bacterium]|nr:ABC transporter ATP-binding protein [Pseudomonadota bacterium]